MFKVDKVNSSLLCMVRGKLCMTIATAFTVTMATHLLLFMLFIDQQLINSVSDGYSTGHLKIKHIQKRDASGIENIGNENNQVPNPESDLMVMDIPKQKDTKLQRKILGDVIELPDTAPKIKAKPSATAQNWIQNTFLHIKDKFFKTSAGTNIDGDDDIQKRLIQNDKLEFRTSIKKIDMHIPKESQVIEQSVNFKLPNGMILLNAQNIDSQQINELINKVDVQEINIIPNKKDHEWDPLEDWDTEHLIVADLKKPKKSYVSTNNKLHPKNTKLKNSILSKLYKNTDNSVNIPKYKNLQKQNVKKVLSIKTIARSPAKVHTNKTDKVVTPISKTANINSLKLAPGKNKTSSLNKKEQLSAKLLDYSSPHPKALNSLTKTSKINSFVQERKSASQKGGSSLKLTVSPKKKALENKDIKVLKQNKEDSPKKLRDKKQDTTSTSGKTFPTVKPDTLNKSVVKQRNH